MTRYYIFKGYNGYKQHVVDNLTSDQNNSKQFPLLSYCTTVALAIVNFDALYEKAEKGKQSMV